LTKLTTSRFFDTGLIGKAASYQELQPFFDYQTQLNDNLIRILINGIGLRDNIDAVVLPISLKPSTPTAFGAVRTPVAVYVGRQQPTTPAITAFVWDMGADGRPIGTLTTADPSFTEALLVTLVIHYS
jgi:hypothetical protein